MSINKLLLWEKWRPRTIEDCILLPRIQKEIENGVNQHYIFYGHYGTGKTSLARILIGKYSKATPYLELNCSMDTSIDVLRTQIDDFCKFTSIMDVDSDIKYVFLDEFERVSANFQDAFKAFIERYNSNVRFIITTNHIGKISDGLKSRIKQVGFDCQNPEEEKFLKMAMFKKIKDIIIPAEEKQHKPDDNDIKKIVVKKFPDFRATLVELQSFFETGGAGDTTNAMSNKTKLELYNLIYSDSNSEQTYHFLMSNFGADKIDEMIKLLGKPFIDWCLAERKDIDKLFETAYIIADYSYKLETQTDPIILGMTIVGKFKEILKSS